MRRIRPRVRAWAVAVLLMQAAGLMAFVPRDCCAFHRHTNAPGGHDEHQPAPPVECPMHAAAGTMCPMHAPRSVGYDQGPEPDCAMRGMCQGAPLFTLLPAPAILSATVPLTVPSGARPAETPVRESLVTHLADPEQPPPRL